MKKGMTFLGGAALFASIILTGCGSNADNKEGKEDDSKKTVLDSDAQKNTNEQTRTSADISELLQGKWQSIDDASNYLVFEGKHRKEIAVGMDEWDDEIFELSDKCSNPSDQDNEIEPEKNRYISCKESDMCWYIIEVDKENLSLSYMSRGNTLKYKRVN
jgi:hypothetical protein